MDVYADQAGYVTREDRGLKRWRSPYEIVPSSRRHICAILREERGMTSCLKVKKNCENSCAKDKKDVSKSRRYIVRTQIDFVIYLTVRVPKRTVESWYSSVFGTNMVLLSWKDGYRLPPSCTVSASFKECFNRLRTMKLALSYDHKACSIA